MYDQGPLGPRALNKVSARPRQPGGRHAVILLGDTSSRDGRSRAVQGFQHAVNASSADAERLGDLGGAVALRLHSRAPWPRLSKAAAPLLQHPLQPFLGPSGYASSSLKGGRPGTWCRTSLPGTARASFTNARSISMI
jgi:hypothetical protein